MVVARLRGARSDRGRACCQARLAQAEPREAPTSTTSYPSADVDVAAHSASASVAEADEGSTPTAAASAASCCADADASAVSSMEGGGRCGGAASRRRWAWELGANQSFKRHSMALSGKKLTRSFTDRLDVTVRRGS